MHQFWNLTDMKNVLALKKKDNKQRENSPRRTLATEYVPRMRYSNITRNNIFISFTMGTEAQSSVKKSITDQPHTDSVLIESIDQIRIYNAFVLFTWAKQRKTLELNTHWQVSNSPYFSSTMQIFCYYQGTVQQN